MLGEDTSDNVLVDLHIERFVDLLGDSSAAKARIALLEFLRRTFDVKGPVVAIEVFPDAIPTPKQKTAARPMLSLSAFQPIERDFAFVVDSDVAATMVSQAAKGADKALIDGVRVFDVFDGAALGDGKKSVAITVVLQPTEKTLTDEEIEAVSQRIVASVEKATGGTLRG